ncbi:MAG: PEP/pyruvate-binding domain-containing protein [Deltaproteobacteria bacterium]|nr:PEP/pyruvate-binding domain-containing protein [Deltaproteobacteria bacterium]
MSNAVSPLVLLPRELGQVPPAVGVVGMKGRGLCQLLTLKARVPRFGIVCAEAFDQHKLNADLQASLREAEGATVVDDATLIGLGEQLVRVALRAPLSAALRVALEELKKSFADDDLFAVRASVVGDVGEVQALAGALDAALAVKNLDETVHRLFALAFHPRTLQARVAAGLLPFGTRMAVVVQRLVSSEQSGVCWSLDTSSDIDERRRRPQARLRAALGLAGGIGGTRGNPRIACDTLLVERPAVADEGLADDARVTSTPTKKPDALRVIDQAGRPEGTLNRPEQHGTRMVAVEESKQLEPALSTVQARMVTKEALRLEAAFAKPQAVSFAFAGRLLHILDVEPLLVPQTRVESNRQRTWDERLVPTSLSAQPSSTLTFSVWQRGTARGLERAGRVLGVRGVTLEETRPQFRRALGVVTGRITGNVEVAVALLDLLPFAEKAREAIAIATGQPEIGARKEAPPPGFWQRAKQAIDGNRWPSQLDRLSNVAAAESAAFSADVKQLLEKFNALDVSQDDPDALLDHFDALEEGLGKCVAALTLSGVSAAMFLVELGLALQETGLPSSMATDLLTGDEDARELLEGTRRLFGVVNSIDQDPELKALFAVTDDPAAVLGVLHEAGDESTSSVRLREHLASLAKTMPEGSLILDEPRLVERPERLVMLLMRLLRSPRVNVEHRVRDAIGRRKKAEYAVEQAADKLGGLKSSSAKKHMAAALAGARKHSREYAILWLRAEAVVAALRQVSLALGERLFEHGLLDQPKDVFHLQDMEVAGVIRGTGPDVDVRPLVSARRRSVNTRPPAMSRRVETRGVVATSLLVDDEAIVTSPGDVSELLGTPVVAGVVLDQVCLADRYPDVVEGAAGVVVMSSVGLLDLPLCAAAAAVVTERGAPLSPVCQALRVLGVPTVVEAPAASMVFGDGESVHVDGDRGVVKRAARAGEQTKVSVAPPAATAEQFLREAIATDPEGRPSRRAARPAGLSQEMPSPPGGGLHQMKIRAPSDEGAPVGDDDVVEESEV